MIDVLYAFFQVFGEFVFCVAMTLAVILFIILIKSILKEKKKTDTGKKE